MVSGKPPLAFFERSVACLRFMLEAKFDRTSNNNVNFVCYLRVAMRVKIKDITLSCDCDIVIC